MEKVDTIRVAGSLVVGWQQPKKAMAEFTLYGLCPLAVAGFPVPFKVKEKLLPRACWSPGEGKRDGEPCHDLHGCFSGLARMTSSHVLLARASHVNNPD